jgi:hypothetical protein
MPKNWNNKLPNSTKAKPACYLIRAMMLMWDYSPFPQKGDTIICDELIHASIIDGARLSHANRYTFRHNDLESLEAS